MTFLARGLAALVVSLVALSTLGCGPGSGTYCQSGPKYGTQCYAQPDVKQSPGATREPEETPRKGEQRTR